MSYTHSFTGITPPPRYDLIPWTLVLVEEAATPDGAFTQRASIAIAEDATPATPNPVDITVTTATLPEGYFRFRFDVAVSNPSPYTDAILSPAATGATYSTPTAVRTELGVTVSVLSDVAAAKLIADAEDVVDGMLGAWLPDETTGRKIVRGDVEEWQWRALDRATAKMAALVYGNPGLLSTVQYDRIKGPDFERSGRVGTAVGSSVVALLDQSGLRRLTGRAVACRGYGYLRPDYRRFLTATRHAG